MKRIKKTKRIETLGRSRVFIWVPFLYLEITDESQGERLLSIQDAKQAVEQFELETHSKFSVYKKDKGFGEKGLLTSALSATAQCSISIRIFWPYLRQEDYFLNSKMKFRST